MMRCELTPEDRAKYTENLRLAEAAYHSLMIGGAVADFTDQNGERVRYTSARKPDLLNYINWLRGQLGMCPFGLAAVSRPAGVYL